MLYLSDHCHIRLGHIDDVCCRYLLIRQNLAPFDSFQTSQTNSPDKAFVKGHNRDTGIGDLANTATVLVKAGYQSRPLLAGVAKSLSCSNKMLQILQSSRKTPGQA